MRLAISVLPPPSRATSARQGTAVRSFTTLSSLVQAFCSGYLNAISKLTLDPASKAVVSGASSRDSVQRDSRIEV